MKRSSLKEMDFLQDIKSIEKEYEINYRHKPLNVSDWNPSTEFKEKVQYLMKMEDGFNPIDYIFSYTFDKNSHNKILEKLGYNNCLNERAILITPNGSSYIRNVLHWLKENKLTQLLTISPTYFTVFYGCYDNSIKYRELFLHRKNGYFYIDEQELFNVINDDIDAIWITNPVYCTSTYFDEYMVNIFIKILEMGKYIISDESLCTSGHELLRKLGNYKKFIGIYSPHKSICVNGNKFSLITFSTEESILFNDWVVALSGNLLISNGIAVNHFLSKNFEIYSTAFNHEVESNFLKLKTFLLENNIDYDYQAEGYLVTLYFSNIEGEKGYNNLFLKKLIYNTGTTLIPGIRNHFSPNLGFCFRVNLCSLTDKMLYALKRLIIYLKDI